MNKNNLKSYAPQARKDFIAAVKARSNMLGLSEQGGSLKVEEAKVSGDIAIIAGREWPLKVEKQRQALVKKIQSVGFQQTIEAVAYTWFNRLVALRYMELHDYLEHGVRVLSNANGPLPEVLNKITELNLASLNLQYATQLKLAGNKDGELYRILLVAQCNTLAKAMPFMFEQIDDETELLLPDNLLLSDSIIAKLVKNIPEEDWAKVEIIGWLYQFYISDKKDQVIGKVVKSEDIPAATQLFTPNWIVQYLVQNSVGRLWMMANPQSTIASQWPYYIKPAEQTPEVNANLQTLIQTRINEDGANLNPETITVLDPACGSGHILVEAYETLKAIYLERGYQLRAIPRLILEKNLYGIDIDDRAAQMAGFALLMKARADDRRLLSDTDNPPKLNIISLQESKSFNADALAAPLASYGVQRNTIATLIGTFAHAKTFGSLIQIPQHLANQLVKTKEQLIEAERAGDLYVQAAAIDVLVLVNQAILLAKQYDAVIANPPYMGGKGMNTTLKEFAKATFPDSKSDLFAMFIERGFAWCKSNGFNSMVTMQSWMFLSSYEVMRQNLINNRTLSCMVHMGNGVMGIAFGTAATIMLNKHINDFIGNFSYCENDDVNEHGVPQNFPVQNERLKTARPDDFKKIPGSPLVYWFTGRLREVFNNCIPLGGKSEIRAGLQTGDNDKFLRYWHEVSFLKVGLGYKSRQEAQLSGKKWFPHNKGGGYRKWFGNSDYLINWEADGLEIKAKKEADLIIGKITPNNSKCWNQDYYFKSGLSWSALTSGAPSIRANGPGYLFDTKGQTLFPLEVDDFHQVHGFLNSNVAAVLLNALSPTLDFNGGVFAKLPFLQLSESTSAEVLNYVAKSVEISKNDWDSNEQSWDFVEYALIPLVQYPLLSAKWAALGNQLRTSIESAKKYEQEINRIFINAFGLQGELSPDVLDDQITLARADREKDCQRLISYAIGCMMGRYSLDEPGLIYAHASNVDFDASRYTKFPADADGIVPITDALWFEDDATNRVREFILAVWGAETLEENLVWLAESLGVKGNGAPLETIRRYISGSFYKDHLQTYKKRPIYWQFSSGKQGAFQALVYLHRYNEGTLARMRSEYVVPLMGKLKSRIEMLEKDANSATSTSTRNKLNKEIEQLNKKQYELQTYDEKLRHHADMRIKLDLDDGVKVNYGKFGDLLSDVKAITGGSDE